MALNLNNHFLQAEDGLFTTLLRNLVLQVILGPVTSGTSVLLVLIWDSLGYVLFRGRFKIVLCSLGTSLGVHTRVGTLLLSIGFESSSILGIARSRWVCSLGSITSGILEVIARQWLVFVILILGLRFEVCRGEIGHVVPSVIFRRLINLVQTIFRWVDL